MSNVDASLSTALSVDHNRLDELLEEASRLLRAGETGSAREAFTAFRGGLERHIRFEENEVFPVFEERTGMRQGPTAVMRREHRAILARLDSMAGALERGDRARFEDDRADLVDTLGPHNAKEERVLYPMADEVVTPAECRELLGRLETA
jgi:regulator of cell morphogenesis and NO signaling